MNRKKIGTEYVYLQLKRFIKTLIDWRESYQLFNNIKELLKE